MNGTVVAAAAVGVLGLVAFGVYWVACLLWPFAACLKCDGDGKTRSPSGKTWRPCRRCDGTGRRLRFGRHVINYLRESRADERRATRRR